MKDKRNIFGESGNIIINVPQNGPNDFKILITNGDINNISPRTYYDCRIWIHNQMLLKNQTLLKLDFDKWIDKTEIDELLKYKVNPNTKHRE